MDNDFTEKLQSILSDKDAVERLKQLAGNLNLQGSASSDKEDSEKNSASDITNIPSQEQEQTGEHQIAVKHSKHSSEDHIRLISAIKPYLSPERQEMADNIIRLLKLMKLTDLNKLLRG